MKEVWWWRQTGVGPFPARQPPPSQERQEASAQEARSQIPEQEDSALGNTPKAPPASGGGAPSSVCENLYQSHGTQPAQGFTSGLFHRHGSGGVAARHVTTLVATCCWWEKSYQRHYYSIAEKAPARLPSVLFLKFLFLIICQQTRPKKKISRKKEITKNYPEELSCSERI